MRSKSKTCRYPGIEPGRQRELTSTLCTGTLLRVQKSSKCTKPRGCRAARWVRRSWAGSRCGPAKGAPEFGSTVTRESPLSSTRLVKIENDPSQIATECFFAVLYCWHIQEIIPENPAKYLIREFSYAHICILNFEKYVKILKIEVRS